LRARRRTICGPPKIYNNAHGNILKHINFYCITENHIKLDNFN